MTKDSYGEISDYFGIPTVEQLITNRHNRLINRFRSQGNYVCQALVMYLKFVSFLCRVSLFICIY